MKMNIKNFMDLERILLEINERHKGDISFFDSYKVWKALKEIGEVTDYFVIYQNDLMKTCATTREAEEIHDKVMADETEYKVDGVIALVDELCDKYDNEDLRSVVKTHKFWTSA